MKSAIGPFRAVLCITTLAMIAWSWPLWLDLAHSQFPRVPFFAHVPQLPIWFTCFRLLALIAALLAAAFAIYPGRSIGLAVVLLAWIVVEDQFRLQPWVYQFLLMGLAMATVPTGQAIGLCRLFVIAMYFHSGLSKLDRAFITDMGPTFLSTAFQWFGCSIQRLPPMIKVGAILIMPMWEISVAVGLIFRLTRKLALAGAVILHVVLIAILGPGGLNHSTIVLFWNGSLIFEVLLLFGGKESDIPQPDTIIPGLASFTRIIFVFAILLPFAESWGFWDSWPSFALYSSHNERMVCEFSGEWDEELLGVPQISGYQPHDAFHGLDLNQWSLNERRVPIYPQGRALNGVAEFLSNRYGVGRPVRVLHLGRADRRTGRRSGVELVGRDAIRRHGNQFWLNAHPTP